MGSVNSPIMKGAAIATAVLMVLCLFDMPYGYYTFVRFAAMVVFAIIAMNCFSNEKKDWAIFFASSALLFQPFIKITLGRTMWNVVDVIEAIVLVVFVFKVGSENSPNE